jgi:hypothetical protein
MPEGELFLAFRAPQRELTGANGFQADRLGAVGTSYFHNCSLYRLAKKWLVTAVDPSFDDDRMN